MKERLYSEKKILIYSITLTLTLLLVLLCVLILIKNNNFKKEYSFNIGIPAENEYEDVYGCSLKTILSYRKFKTYSWNNDKAKDELLFKQIQSEIRTIVKNNDSENGVHVTFNAKTKYQDVIRTLDICEIEKVDTHILDDFDVWIMTGKNLELEKDCSWRIPHDLQVK